MFVVLLAKYCNNDEGLAGFLSGHNDAYRQLGVVDPRISLGILVITA